MPGVLRLRSQPPGGYARRKGPLLLARSVPRTSSINTLPTTPSTGASVRAQRGGLSVTADDQRDSPPAVMIHPFEAAVLDRLVRDRRSLPERRPERRQGTGREGRPASSFTVWRLLSSQFL